MSDKEKVHYFSQLRDEEKTQCRGNHGLFADKPLILLGVREQCCWGWLRSWTLIGLNSLRLGWYLFK